MKAIEIIERFQRIDHMIKTNHTGSPEQFAEKLGVSRRQLFKDLEDIREIGVIISYSRTRETYYYYNGFELDIDLNIRNQLVSAQKSAKK